MMKTEIIEKMEQFAERVLQGDDSVTPQETATLPEVLKILKCLQEGDSTETKTVTIKINGYEECARKIKELKKQTEQFNKSTRLDEIQDKDPIIREIKRVFQDEYEKIKRTSTCYSDLEHECQRRARDIMYRHAYIGTMAKECFKNFLENEKR